MHNANLFPLAIACMLFLNSGSFAVTPILSADGKQLHNQFNNTSSGVKSFQSWLKKEKIPVENTLICMEHTGMYGKILSTVLLANNYNLWIEMSLRIIRSSGV